MNKRGRIGGDGDLTEGGRQYSKALANFIEQQELGDLKVCVLIRRV